MAVKPLGDTVRCVEWEELPARAREIPDGFDPSADGVLMQHQVEWLRIPAPIKVCSKGRRTGITFAEGLDAPLTAGATKEAGGMDVYYIGDTKEKGLEFIGYCAKFSKTIAQAQAGGISEIEEFLFEDQQEDGTTKHITSYRIRYASGFKIVALSSNPANIRGLQGKVIIDEAAFHRNVAAVIDAATALLIWGGRVSIISTHNGRTNAFNSLIKDIHDQRYGDSAEVYTCTFDDAVANGLYERVCMMKGEKATIEGKAKWYATIRNAYGPRKAQMREELDAIPRDGTGTSMPGIWIDNAMPSEPYRPVVRLKLADDFATKPVEERESWCDDWIKKYIDPVLALSNPEHLHVYGHDFARHRDYSIFAPLAIEPGRHRYCPFVLEMHKVPTRQQEQIIWYVLDRLPRFCGGAMDATGSGETLAEYTADKYGSGMIAQVKLNRAWYGSWMPKMIQQFEDGTIQLPKDQDLANDLRAVEEIDGIPMVAKQRRKDLKDPDTYRHGDFAPALALAVFASIEMRQGPVEVSSRHRRKSGGLLEGYDA